MCLINFDDVEVRYGETSIRHLSSFPLRTSCTLSEDFVIFIPGEMFNRYVHELAFAFAKLIFAFESSADVACLY